jgi:choline monooxygenase
MLDAVDIKRVRQPIENARTLPKHAFTDQDFFIFECEHILSKTWTAVDFGARIPAAGDSLTTTLYGCPVFLIRNKKGTVNAFHNVSPYDGCEILLRSRRGITEIETPYHGWCYDLDGKLLIATYFDGRPVPDRQPENMDLVPVPCHEWMGTLFVSLNADVESFSSYLSPVMKYISEFDLEDLNIGLNETDSPMIDTLPIRANWKTAYENYSPNIYHENSVHKMYRRSSHVPRVDDEGNKTYTEIIDPAGFIGLSYDNSVGSSFYPESPFPQILFQDGTPSTRNLIANMFPNWAITILNQYARIALFVPERVDLCTEMIATYYRGTSASSIELYSARKVAAHGGVVARIEDNEICESVQRARGSPAFDSFPYSPFWDKPHYALTNIIVDKLETAVSEDSAG